MLLIDSRKVSSLVLVAAGLTVVALLSAMFLMHGAVRAAPPASAKSTSPSQATVALVNGSTTNTVNFSPASVTLTHNTTGKALLNLANQTGRAQTITVGTQHFTLQANQVAHLALGVGSATFSDGKASLTATVR